MKRVCRLAGWLIELVFRVLLIFGIGIIGWVVLLINEIRFLCFVLIGLK